MNETPDFEQNYYSSTGTGIYKIGHHSIRLMKCLAYFDRFLYESVNYYDPMASVLSCLNEISER